MIGSVVSHYRILSPLGAGGMGVVYLAEDLRLGRQVAVKFLPPEAAKSPQALERFHLEARAVSLLTHPGICALYDIGMHDGAPFLVMERLKGETLRARITRGRVPVAEVLDIGIQLAEALEAAHAQGIVHRDIKPANIWVGEKLRVKILDFGLAKLAPPGEAFGMGADDEDAQPTRVVPPRIDNPLTMPGMAIGTALYMSPEQARGEVVDARTDLFSLGVVLYEMLTGQQAFAGSTAAVVFDAILNRVPIPPSAHNPSIPGRLQDVIQATLEKRREDRLQSAALLEGELRRIRREVYSAVRGPTTIVTPDAAAPGRVDVTAPTVVRGTAASDATMVVPPPVAAAATVSAGPSSSAPTVATAPPAASGATTVAAAAPGPARRAGWPVAVAAIAAAVAIAIWGIFRVTSGGTTPPAVADLVARAQQRLDAHDLRGALVEAGAALTYDATNAEAARIKGEVEAALTKVDAAVSETRRALAAGDVATAGAALETAQALAPGDPMVVSLAAQLARSAAMAPPGPAAGAASPATTSTAATPPDSRRTMAAPSATPPAEPGREAEAARSAIAPGSPSPPPASADPAPSGTAPNAAPAAPAAAAPVPEPAVNAGPRPADTPSVTEPRPAPSDPAPAAPRPPAAERESDEAAVRRALHTYEQAIENKDLALFRTIRPDLSADEEKRLRASFQQIERQHVELRVDAVTLSGDRADVRVTREDTIQNGGRAQTSRSTQTIRLARRGGAWIIVSLGR